MGGARVREIKASNSDPGLQGRRLKFREFLISRNVTFIARNDCETLVVNLSECKVQMSEPLRVDLTWTYAVAKAVSCV